MRDRRLPRFLIPLLLLAVASLSAEEFAVPDAATRLAATGDVSGLSPILQRAFTDETGVAPVPAPQSRDWLANQPEIGQTWAEYLTLDPNLPQGQRKVIYLQPLGNFDATQQQRLEDLRTFMALYFGLTVKLKPVRPLDRLGITERVNEDTEQKQYLAGDFLKVLRQRLPGDAYCLLGITLVDLYPDPDWNFVFGLASLKNRVGIFSLARYDQRFFDATAEPTDATLYLQRCLKVLAHETGHMFGIKHEIYWHCLMNGSNHLGETDQAPLHLCPLNLRKLHHAVGFDVVDRYRALQAWYQEKGLTAEAEWVTARLAVITAE